MVFLLSACGSRSSDFTGTPGVENPLSPCPDSPNCVRITETYPGSIDEAWEAVLTALKEMKPYDIEMSPDEYRVDSIFLVVFFRDDMAVQLEAPKESSPGSESAREKGSDASGETAYIHIRSSSRAGYYDFGVNRRRVKEFLEKLSPQ